MTERIICPKCGKSTPDARFCKHCGEPMHSCIACGAKISGDSRFCTECGIELAPDQAGALTEAIPKAYARYGPSMIPKDMLIEGEEPIFETRPALWLSLMPPITFIIVGVGILVGAYFPFHVKGILYGCGGIAFLGIVWALMAWLRWRYTIYGATTRRVMCQRGVIDKTYLDLPLAGVANIYLDISVWGRFNGVGTLRIAGAGTEIIWEDIDDPKEAHRLLNQIVDQYRRQRI
jgi:membrane protein YdbS with pleckstrin-like domain